MKKLLYLFLLLAVSVRCAAQTRAIDSLKQILNTSNPDSNRVKTYRWLAYNYEGAWPDSALSYASAGIGLGHKLGYTPGEARCLRVKGDVLETLGNYTGSLEAYLSSLKLFEQLGDETNQAVVYTCIGILYRDQDDYGEALKNTFRAKDLILHSSDPRELTVTLLNIGFFYYKLKKTELALDYEQQAYRMAVGSAQPEYLSNILQNLGMIQEQLGHGAAALSYYQQSVAQALAQGDLGSQADTYLSLAKYYQAGHKNDSAIAYAQMALQLSLTTSYATGQLDAATLLAVAYDSSNPIQSYHYYKMADSAKEELYNTEKLRQLQNLQYEERERQQELATLKEEAAAERSENLQLLGIAGFIPGFFLLLLVLSRVHIRQRVIDVLGVASALLVFEFITLLLHPRIAAFTHHKPVPELLVLMLMAAIFAPLHHRFHHWVKAMLVKAARRKAPPPVQKTATPKQ